MSPLFAEQARSEAYGECFDSNSQKLGDNEVSKLVQNNCGTQYEYKGQWNNEIVHSRKCSPDISIRNGCLDTYPRISVAKASLRVGFRCVKQSRSVDFHSLHRIKTDKRRRIPGQPYG